MIENGFIFDIDFKSIEKIEDEKNYAKIKMK